MHAFRENCGTNARTVRRRSPRSEGTDSKSVLRTSLFFVLLVAPSAVTTADDDVKVPRIAAIVTVYRHNSHADVIVGRILEGYHLDGDGEFPRLKLASLYTDQVPNGDKSRDLARQHGFPIHDTVAEALTLGTGKLAVDGVLVVAEHGEYERSESGQRMYPKRRLHDEIAEVFEESGRSVPVFSDKHLADNWQDAKHVYDLSRRLEYPLMAGSSLPVVWRRPAADVRRGARLDEMVALSYGSLDAYGFHALEMVQCLAERRTGGETGVKSVRCLEGDAVWRAHADGLFDDALFRAALARLERPAFVDLDNLKQRVKAPVLFVIDYRDGFRASILTLNGGVGDWTVAWREAGRDEVESTRFETQQIRPYDHFTHLLKGAETLFRTSRPTWPVERTLLTSGILDAAHLSKLKGEPVETPYLDVQYETEWKWSQPPPAFVPATPSKP
jgi:hypothetical protein